MAGRPLRGNSFCQRVAAVLAVTFATFDEKRAIGYRGAHYARANQIHFYTK